VSARASRGASLAFALALVGATACEPSAELGAHARVAPQVPLSCSPSSADICNGRDDDCDGAIDEEDVCAHPCRPVQVSGDCAVRGDGTVWCWGRRLQHPGTAVDQSGRPRRKPPPSPEAPGPIPGLTDVLQVAATELLSCARKSDGSLWCWGFQPPDVSPTADDDTIFAAEPRRVLSLEFDVVDVALGRGGCVRKRDGSTWCWGENWNGEVGDGARTPRWVPVPVPTLGLRAVRLAAREMSRAALLADGSVWRWGTIGDVFDYFAFLGGKATVGVSTPAPIPGVADAQDLVLSRTHGCTLTRSQRALCWGKNSSGQLGDGTLTSTLAAVPASLFEEALAISAFEEETCVVKPAGWVVCAGRPTFTGPTNRPEELIAEPWGEDLRARLVADLHAAVEGSGVLLRRSVSIRGETTALTAFDLCASGGTP
jgi:alpha-tubulin suppressor-like RCC1 family protein